MLTRRSSWKKWPRLAGTISDSGPQGDFDCSIEQGIRLFRWSGSGATLAPREDFGSKSGLRDEHATSVSPGSCGSVNRLNCSASARESIFAASCAEISRFYAMLWTEGTRGDAPYPFSQLPCRTRRRGSGSAGGFRKEALSPLIRYPNGPGRRILSVSRFRVNTSLINSNDFDQCLSRRLGYSRRSDEATARW
jgi:hypothetical protein